jgi:hypothetical protein
MAPRDGKDVRILSECLRLLAYLGRGLASPHRLYLRDLTLGILCSKSCQLSAIARTLVAPEDLPSEYQRLERALGRYDLTRAYERAQDLILSELDASHLFVFDPSEMVKPFGEKLEALQLVRDGSEKPRRVRDEKAGKWKEVPVLKPGYPLRVAIALDPSGAILPAELSLYSSGEESFLSSNDENIQVIDTLLQKTNFQPTLVLDREFDSFSIYRHLLELRQRFVIRVTQNRKFLPWGVPRSPGERTYSREEMMEKDPYLSTENVIPFSSKTGVIRPTLCRFRAARVRLLSEQKKISTFRDTGDEQALVLVELKLLKSTGVPTLYLLTSVRPTIEKELEGVGRAYLARWNIEEYIRFLKQHFGLEEFLVRDLGRMRGLIQAVYIATVILHELTDPRAPYARGRKNHDRLIDASLAIERSERENHDFFLYAYGRGLANLIQRNRELLGKLNSRPKKAQKPAA